MRKIAMAVTAALVLAGGASAAQAGSVQIGVLVCGVGQGNGFIFGSTKRVRCNFVPALSGTPSESYSGVITRYGVDLGHTNEGVLRWAVLATNFKSYSPGALAGNYGGIGAEATTAIGVGANVLVRGSLLDYMLQPLSVQGQTGLNVALGVAGLTLASR